MKTFPLFASTLCLAAALGTARAQTPATTGPKGPKPVPATAPTADQRAAAYKGPKVVKSSKALGSKMIQHSKPATSPLQSRPVRKLAD